jgi:hypothetical protein
MIAVGPVQNRKSEGDAPQNSRKKDQPRLGLAFLQRIKKEIGPGGLAGP